MLLKLARAHQLLDLSPFLLVGDTSSGEVAKDMRASCLDCRHVSKGEAEDDGSCPGLAQLQHSHGKP